MANVHVNLTEEDIKEAVTQFVKDKVRSGYSSRFGEPSISFSTNDSGVIAAVTIMEIDPPVEASDE